MNDKVAEAIIEILLDHANAQEAAAVNLKHRIAEVLGPKEMVAVKEETFLNLLGWEEGKGNKLGTFQYTTRKANNNSEAFNHAYNILKANNPTISSRFHDVGYKHSYWLYEQKPDTIYRQALKTK